MVSGSRKCALVSPAPCGSLTQSLHHVSTSTSVSGKGKYCSLCGKRYAHRSGLCRHKRIIHKKSSQFICFHCSRKFTNKEYLYDHVKKVHLLNKTYNCKLCTKKFTSISDRRHHIQERHRKKTEKGFRYECPECHKTYAKKGGLDRHKVIHEENASGIENHFECFHCGGKFKRKDALKEHILKFHFRELLPFFECYYCKKLFSRKSDLGRHLERHIEAAAKPSIGRYQCLHCNYKAPSKKTADVHYERVHGIELERRELHFESVEHFFAWKVEMERTNVTHFRCDSTQRLMSRYKKYFICHRSGVPRDVANHRPRQRAPKFLGSKKLGGYCPAEIVMTFDEKGCRVDWQRTHVGHSISTCSELAHIYWDQSEKAKIASRLLDEVKRVPSKTDLSGDGGVSLEDIDYVETMEAVEREQTCVQKGESAIQAYVMQNEEVFLFYKTQGMEDETYGMLQKEDYVIILMGNNQADQLQRYGDQVVCVDGTYGSCQYDFHLHTLLVLDSNYEGIPVGFLISNRDDDVVIDIFIQCIRDRVGIVTPQCFMSDLQTTYYESWVKHMGEPQLYLYCASQVVETWRKTMKMTIVDAVKRKAILDELRSLQTELDEVLFEEKLEEFVNRTEEDLSKFLDYFRSHFYEQRRRWAYCYRKFAGVNTNEQIDSFHKSLKRNIPGGKKVAYSAKRIISLHEGLKYLEEYCVKKELEIEICHARGGTLKQIHRSNVCHQRAAEFFSTNNGDRDIHLFPLNDQSWEVQSFQESNDGVLEIYIIERVDKECSSLVGKCHLICQECDACLHQYRCTCVTSCIEAVMCEHIHLLRLYQTALEERSPDTKACLNISYDYFVEMQCGDEKNETFEKMKIEEVQIENIYIPDDETIEELTVDEKSLVKNELPNEFARAVGTATNPEISIEIRRLFADPVMQTLQNQSS